MAFDIDLHGILDRPAYDLQARDCRSTRGLPETIRSRVTLHLNMAIHQVPGSTDPAGSRNPIRILIVENHRLVADTLAAFLNQPTGHAGRGQRCLRGGCGHAGQRGEP